MNARLAALARLPLGGIAALLIGGIAALPLWFAPWWQAHEYIFPALRLHALTRMMQAEGALFVPWIPEFFFGHGSPYFLFYPPLAYWLAAPWHLLGADPFAACRVAYALGFCLSALTMYGAARAWARLATGAPSRLPALLAAAIYTFAPYHFVDVYLRGALAEATVFVWLPLPWHAVALLETGQKRAGIGLLALGATGMVLTHPATAWFAIGCLLLFCLCRAELRRHGLAVGAGLLIAALLTAFYWLPVLIYAPLTNLSDPDYAWTHPERIRNLSVYPHQWFLLRWGFGGTEPGWNDDMSYAIGIPAWLILLGAPWAMRRSQNNSGTGRVIAWFYALALLSLLMQTHAMPWWIAPEALRYAQFPWRLLSLTALFFALTGGLCAARWMSEHRARAAVLLALILMPLTIFSWFRLNVEDWYQFDYPAMLHEVETRGFVGVSFGEHLPRGVNIATTKPEWHAAHPAPEKIAWPERAGVVESYRLEGARHEYVLSATEPTHVEFRGHAFPVWRLRINGNDETRQLSRTDQGFLTFPLAPGRHQVAVYAAWPPALRWGLTVSMLGVLAGATLLVRRG